MRKALVIVAVVLMVLLGGAVLLLGSTDFDRYRDELARRVQVLTGREVTIAGALHLHLLTLTPGIRVEGVSLANAEWGSQPQMLRVGRLEAQVALLPLLRGELQVKRLVLRDADLLLETDVTGRRNWRFAPAAAPAPPADGSPSPSLPLVEEVVVDEARVTWRNGASGAVRTLAVDRLRGGAPALDAPLSVALQGALDGWRFTLQGEFGSLADLAADRGVPLHLVLGAGESRLALEGRVAHPLEAAGLDVKLRGEGPDLAGLAGLGGVRPPDAGPWQLAAALRGDLDRLELAGLDASLGGSDLAGSAGLTLRPGPARLEAELHSTRLDLRALGGTRGPPPAAARERVFSAEPLPVAGLAGIDAHLTLQVQRLLAPGLSAGAVQLEATLQGGTLRIAPLSATLADGALSGELSLASTEDPPALSLRLSGRQLDLGRLLEGGPEAGAVRGRMDLEASLHGRGRSPAAVMGSLGGHARALMGRGHARVEALDALVGGARRMLGTLFAERAEAAVVNCAAASFRVAAGIATSELLLVDTEYSTVRGTGTVDLGRERLDLVITPEPKSVTLSVAVPVEVGGTLAEPTFVPDKLATARKIGGLLGVVLFPPAAIAGLSELGTGEDNECLKIATGGAGQAAGEAGDGGATAPAPAAPSVSEQAAESVKDAVEGLGETLRGLFGGGSDAGGGARPRQRTDR